MGLHVPFFLFNLLTKYSILGDLLYMVVKCGSVNGVEKYLYWALVCRQMMVDHYCIMGSTFMSPRLTKFIDHIVCWS